METKPETKTKAKSEVEPKEPAIVTQMRSQLDGLTPHGKRVALTEALRQYGHEPQSPEFVSLSLLANEVGVVF